MLFWTWTNWSHKANDNIIRHYFLINRFQEWQIFRLGRRNNPEKLGQLGRFFERNVFSISRIYYVELTKVETMDQFIERTELKSNYNYVSVWQIICWGSSWKSFEVSKRHSCDKVKNKKLNWCFIVRKFCLTAQSSVLVNFHFIRSYEAWFGPWGCEKI